MSTRKKPLNNNKWISNFNDELRRFYKSARLRGLGVNNNEKNGAERKLMRNVGCQRDRRVLCAFEANTVFNFLQFASTDRRWPLTVIIAVR